MAQFTKKEYEYRLQIWASLTSILSTNTALHYEAASKLASDKANEIVNEVRLMNLPDRPDIETVDVPY